MFLSFSRNKMHSISEYFDEYHLRWEQIEKVCGYSIVSSTASTPTHSSSLTHMDSLLSFTREGSPHSISSFSTVTSTQSSRQRKGSSPEFNESRLHSHSRSQLADQTFETEPELGRFVKSEPSKLIHSTSFPVLRRASAEVTDSRFVEADGGLSFASIEKNATRGLEPIKEEKQGTHTQKRTLSLIRKSKSSDV